MGNICRSPVAEGIFLHRAAALGVRDRFVVDSAGTGGWHAGERADRRSIEVARRRGVELVSIARQVTTDDFERFDRLIIMDRRNEDDLLAMGAPASKLSLLLRHHPAPPTLEVPDPYYGGPEGFEHMFDLIDLGCRGLLEAELQ